MLKIHKNEHSYHPSHLQGSVQVQIIRNVYNTKYKVSYTGRSLSLRYQQKSWQEIPIPPRTSQVSDPGKSLSAMLKLGPNSIGLRL
jgi:hypothetical protein